MNFLAFAGRGQRGRVIEGPSSASFGRPRHVAVQCGVERWPRGAAAIGLSHARYQRHMRAEPSNPGASSSLDGPHAGASLLLSTRARIMRTLARARGEPRGPLAGPRTRTDSLDEYPDREA
jgi:hypothetical protein